VKVVLYCQRCGQSLVTETEQVVPACEGCGSKSFTIHHLTARHHEGPPRTPYVLSTNDKRLLRAMRIDPVGGGDP